jgi:hypothetical protein
MLVLGTGLGMATKRPRTKNSAAPMPMATMVLTENFFILSFLHKVFIADAAASSIRV